MNISTAPLNLPLNTAHQPTEAARDQRLQLNKIPEPNQSQSSANSRSAPNQESHAESPISQSAEADNLFKKVASKNNKDKDDSQHREQNEEKREAQQESELINQLKAREREVIRHEQAHASIGGQYAGAPQYEYKKGPDNRSYINGGEVSIDTSEEASPQQTLRKAEIIMRAALAPAEPSEQDRKVAADAAAMALKAQAEISKQNTLKSKEDQESNSSDQSTTELSNDKQNGIDGQQDRLSVRLNYSGAISSNMRGQNLSIAV
jgi:hypothetical protein